MRIKLDENLGRSGVEIFEAAGHDVETVLSEGLCSGSDEELIEICRMEKRAVVTLDLDFANPLVFAPRKYAGIAVLRLPKKAGHRDLLEAQRSLVHGLARANIQGKLWIVSPGQIREYQPAQ